MKELKVVHRCECGKTWILHNFSYSGCYIDEDIALLFREKDKIPKETARVLMKVLLHRKNEDLKKLHN